MAKPRTTLRDVARRVGVHPSTVSRVLSPVTRDMVSAQLTEKVQQAVDEMGYRANPFAYSLKTNRSFTVGVLIPDLTNPLFPPIIRAIDHTLGKAGYTAMLADVNENPVTEQTILDRMKARQIDGLILATSHRHDERVRECLEEGISTVLINRTIEDESVCSITVDDINGVRLAIDHLVSLGHKKIGHIAGPQYTSTAYARYHGYMEAMRAHGMDPTPDLVVFCDDFSEEEGNRATRTILGADPGVTALVAATDLLALGCYDALDERGILCPRGVSVVGYNDMPFVDKFRPPLTTIRIPLGKMGSMAADALLELMGDENAHVKSVVLAPELIIRGSTAPVRK